MSKYTEGPWVWGGWTILNEDRPAQKRGEPYWTLVPPEDLTWGETILTRGPIGRKAMEPERIIYGDGYETDGVIVENEADKNLITKAWLVPEMLEVLEDALPHLSGVNLHDRVRNIIAKAKG